VRSEDRFGSAPTLERLQKVLAARGVASRRHAEELIAAGRVRVDGVVVRELGTKVAPDARIEVDGRAIASGMRLRYVALNKPLGVVSSARAERGRASVADLVGARERLYPVGRLDVDSEGLVLLTNDGDWAERVLHPRYGHDREYEVDVEGELTDDVLSRLRRGVRLEEGLARAERVTAVARERGGGRLRMVLRTGWKRQVRRMCVALGLRVRRLVRVRIGALSLGRLRTGTWRELTEREVRALAASTRAGAA
jgi:23S rRNA pseudouridine2605 synthase